MSDLKEMIQKVIAFRDERDWKQFHKPKDVALSLNLEASELLEHFQWKSDQQFADEFEENKEAFADELSDVLYWVLLLGHDLDIDLKSALENKIKKNEAKYPLDKVMGNNKKYTEYL